MEHSNTQLYLNTDDTCTCEFSSFPYSYHSIVCVYAICVRFISDSISICDYIFDFFQPSSRDFTIFVQCHGIYLSQITQFIRKPTLKKDIQNHEIVPVK